MKVTILGNGGAISSGLPYNSFIIDGTFLVETPPDIMNSLFREGIPAESISDIYISHLHGDHTFGFPFLALKIFYEAMRSRKHYSLRIFIPANGMEYIKILLVAALSEGHPCIDWVFQNTEFINISEQSEFSALNCNFRLYRMDHYAETYGFLIYRDARPLAAYTADTKWCGSVENILSEGPSAVIIDLNGEPDDPVPVHISENDIFDKGLTLLKPGTILYGTHLKNDKISRDDRIRYALPGMAIIIE